MVKKRWITDPGGCREQFPSDVAQSYKAETSGKEGTHTYSKINKKIDHHIKKLENILTKAKFV